MFWAAGWVFPWFRRRLPPRPWRRVVAAVQGVVLVVAAASVLPDTATYAALAVALALLGESFGHDVLWLVRHRRDPMVDLPAGSVPDGCRAVSGRPPRDRRSSRRSGRRTHRASSSARRAS